MSDIDEIKKKNVGLWIAVREGSIIAKSKDYHELHRMLKEKGIKEKITVVHSTSPEEKKYGFLLKLTIDSKNKEFYIGV